MQDAQLTLPTDYILSQAAIILPLQYLASIGGVGVSGEQRLMLAMLVDAVNVLPSWQGSGSVRKRRNFAEAAQWVNARGTSYPFSFDSVCAALEIDAELLRSRLHVLTVRSANSARRPALPRLRLKELSRSQHMAVNRSPRREHNRRIVGALIERTSEASPRWEWAFRTTQDCTVKTSACLTAFGEKSSDGATGQSVSW